MLPSRTPTVWIVDDDDQRFLRSAFEESELPITVVVLSKVRTQRIEIYP